MIHVPTKFLISCVILGTFLSTASYADGIYGQNTEAKREEFKSFLLSKLTGAKTKQDETESTVSSKTETPQFEETQKVLEAKYPMLAQGTDKLTDVIYCIYQKSDKPLSQILDNLDNYISAIQANTNGDLKSVIATLPDESQLKASYSTIKSCFN